MIAASPHQCHTQPAAAVQEWFWPAVGLQKGVIHQPKRARHGVSSPRIRNTQPAAAVQGWYWPAIGPQNTLYVPGPVLKACNNELLLLEVGDQLTADAAKTGAHHSQICDQAQEAPFPLHASASHTCKRHPSRTCKCISHMYVRQLVLPPDGLMCASLAAD